ncbi:MlaD family protein [bacterium]|nr:MlaD family protein [bacterium]
MEFKSNEVKSGLMITASVIILVVFLIAIFGVNFSEDQKHYDTKLKYVGGIVRGSLVKFGGMDVGQVTGVLLPPSGEDDTRIRITFSVDPRTPIRVNSEAYVTSVGIMKDQHIEISPGSLDTDLLPSGGTLASKEVLSFAQMAEPLGDLSGQVNELLSRFILLFNEQNRDHLSSALANVDTLLQGGKLNLLAMVENLEDLTNNLASVSDEMNSLLANNRGNFDETLGHLERTTEQTTKLITDLRSTLAVVENMMSSNTSSIAEIMENFQFASQNLEEFTRILKERPWLLVRKAAPPERKTP